MRVFHAGFGGLEVAEDRSNSFEMRGGEGGGGGGGGGGKG
jgi:hypothetical protein